MIRPPALLAGQCRGCGLRSALRTPEMPRGAACSAPVGSFVDPDGNAAIVLRLRDRLEIVLSLKARFGESSFRLRHVSGRAHSGRGINAVFPRSSARHEPSPTQALPETSLDREAAAHVRPDVFLSAACPGALPDVTSDNRDGLDRDGFCCTKTLRSAMLGS